MDGENTTRAFARSLATLKRRGCNLLVTGSVRDGSHLQLSKQLMGDAESRRRWRVVVATDTSGIGTRCPEKTDPQRYQLIDRRPAMRSSAVRASSSSPLDLFGLAREISETIEAFDDDADGLSAGELRLCVDSLHPLLDTHSSDAIERFINTTTDHINEANGMGHFHLPVDPERPIVPELISQFDVHIELRADKHRWHILNKDIQTGWLRI